LHNSITRCKENNHDLAVMFLDLDRFKNVNDLKGHLAGDDLLKQVGERLVKSVRDVDLVARQGGDEFILLLEDIQPSQVKKVAEGILEQFSQPFTLTTGDDFFISPSIGISLLSQDKHNSETLFENADTAMYESKRRGKNTYQFFAPSDNNLDRKIKLEQGLKQALQNNEFELYYQPKVEIKNRNIYGVEALIRWKHPELGSISPNEFIPIAEDVGMILPLGKWVLQEACNQNKAWQDTGIYIKMSVNVSIIQFEDIHFMGTIRELLRESQLSPEYLSIEITESIMQNIVQSSTTIQELQNIGIRIAIDDFGTGYSSLSVINNLSIDTLKIDKSFVNDILYNSNAATLVKTIIEMGKNLDLDLVAEGIENEQQATFLIENGCSLGQGYLYSRPLPADKVESLLRNQLIQV
ncbi:putative bifunctional diguanylate cyclase/phosphodiesterase, partial [Virgibacillus sp. DJP39]|uniref:putative bifunctional diguanylate cyclase/phosphodiesterase n=1 Tax=Virgibacillus sp. DJP39 TaxID=3409790 RepID=UPI003BB6EAFD